MLNPTEGSQTVIPAFIAKLWHMISDSSTDNLISWGQDGTTFVIKDHNKFSSEMLPMYYKHNNMASFIRQLNMYSFHKVLLVESSSLKNHKELEFSHPYFVRDQPNLLTKIQRKIHTKEPTDTKCDPIVFNNLLKEVKQLRAIQEIFSTKLAVMKKENAALWREHSILRQRHAKQEKIVNKVIHFLISMVHQSSMNVPRRKVPLMIKDRPIPMKPSNKRKFVKVLNPKSSALICEVDPQDLADTTGQMMDEEIKPEDLLSYSNIDEDEDEIISNTQDNLSTQQIFAQQLRAKMGLPKTVNQAKPDRVFLKPVKRKTFNLNIQQPDNKRIKADDRGPAEYILPVNVSDAHVPTSSEVYSEAASTPEYIIINNEDDIAELLSGDVEMVASPDNNGIILQGTTRSESTIPQFKSTSNSQLSTMNPSIQTMKTVAQNVTQQLEASISNAQSSSDSVRLTSSPIPIVSSPAQSIPSPASSQTASTTTYTLAENSSNSPQSLVTSPGKSLLQLAIPTNLNENIKNKQDSEYHLDRVQSDLNILKDLLKGEGISLDANMVLELFNDNPIDLNMGLAGEHQDPLLLDEPSSSKQALISYTPSLLDLEPPELPVDSELADLDETVSDFILNTPKVRTETPNFPNPQ